MAAGADALNAPPAVVQLSGAALANRKHSGSSHNGNGNGRVNGSAQDVATGVATANGHGGSRQSRRKTTVRNLIEQDRKLVERCVGGEAAAWTQMYDRFQGALLASIRAFLGKAGQDMHLVDEVSARVWFSLVRNQFELLAKFDPLRGCRLSTFLSVLGKSEARLLLRSERRRKTRECVASRPEVEPADAECGSVLSDDDFLATLSPRERAFYLDILIATCATSPSDAYSPQNQWQLRHRVRKKLEQFLE